MIETENDGYCIDESNRFHWNILPLRTIPLTARPHKPINKLKKVSDYLLKITGFERDKIKPGDIVKNNCIRGLTFFKVQSIKDTIVNNAKGHTFHLHYCVKATEEEEKLIRPQLGDL